MYSHYLSFDVEALGLYGDAFAVGWVVVDASGKEKENGYLISSVSNALGSADDRLWIEANVLPHLPAPNCRSVDEVQSEFWKQWIRIKATYSNIAAIVDCGYPVESNFLAECTRKAETMYLADRIQATKAGRTLPQSEPKWSAPYPLLDVAPLLLALGKNPIGDYDRLPTELPKHNPVCDARQSVRVFLECMNLLTSQRTN
jgi:hypothetical protein